MTFQALENRFSDSMTFHARGHPVKLTLATPETLTVGQCEIDSFPALCLQLRHQEVRLP